ncbi:thioesterase [Candidatus Dependentiae bacterium]|nr:thioesterase [Candidatus Dependentiae bacterium]
MSKFKLFCIPYAGGSATVFYKWKNLLISDIELIPCELSGRGSKISQPLYDSISAAADDVLKTIIKNLNESHYAFFAHSMGTLILYELLYKINFLNLMPPVISIFSGRFPPHIKPSKIHYNQPRSEFINDLRETGGTSEEILNNDELLDFFIPIIRADYKITETYEFSNHKEKFNHDIAVFYGSNDADVKESDVYQWKNYTNKKCNFYKFNAGHFFINDNLKDVIDTINFLFSEILINRR